MPIWGRRGRKEPASPPSDWPGRATFFAQNVGQLQPKLGLDWSIESVARLDTLIARMFDGKPQGLATPSFVEDLGAYVGEVIVRSIGGTWTTDGTPAIIGIDGIEAAYPLARARTRIERGPTESLAWWVEVIARHAREDGV